MSPGETLQPIWQDLQNEQSQWRDGLGQWVQCNSFSAHRDGLLRMLDFLQTAFSVDGLSVQTSDGAVAPHFIAKTPEWGSPNARGLLLIGHHDTVFPPGSFDVWEPAETRWRGPGVLDMKGGLWVIARSLAAMARQGALQGLPIAVLSVSDEETGSRSSQAALAELAKSASAALVFESGRLDDVVVTRRKGTGSAEVKVVGRPAHAGNNHAQGRNAIWGLAKFIDAAQQLTNYEQGITINIGTVEGGTTSNTVPEFASCKVDFRFLTKAQGPKIIEDLNSLAQQVGGALGLTFSLHGDVHRPPLERNAVSERLYSWYAMHAKASGLGSGESPLVGGGSDANNVSSLGVPAIDALGPRGDGFHTKEEWIDPSSLLRKMQALTGFLHEWRASSLKDAARPQKSALS